MVLNNKGQTVIVSIMVFFMVFIIAVVLISPMKDIITDARGGDQLNCSSEDITIGESSTCLVIDLILPYFIAIILALAGGIVTYQKLSAL